VGYRLRSFDHIVVGAGGLGAAVAYFLSRRTGHTLALERFYENHPFGSSHGRTRILRTAYAEGSVFVPLVLRARTLWRRLGKDTGQELFRPTGVLLAGRAGASQLERAGASARSNHLPYEFLDDERARRRFPTFRFTRSDVALWDPGGGVLFPERAISAFRRSARRRGVQFRWNSPVLRWSSRSDGKVLVAVRNREYLADRVVLTVGAWLPGLVPSLPLPLSVEQQTVSWFRPQTQPQAQFRSMPAFVWYLSRGEYFYGIPDLGDGVKVGGSAGQIVRNLARRPPSSAREIRALTHFVRARLPGLGFRPIDTIRCLYTNTPDQNFIIDFLPECPHVLLASACSGHGFKFVPALGELIAKAATTGTLSPELAPFHFPSKRTP
jgi:sarcosine oxidase